MQRKDTVRFRRISAWLTGLLAVCLLAGVAAPAKAATLSYTGTLSLVWGDLPAATGVGGGVAQAVTFAGHLSTLVIPAGAFGPISASLPVTSSPTIQSVRLTGLQNLSAQITGISGGPPLGSGLMGLQGVAKICLFSGCATHLNFSFTPVAGVGFGVGGTQIGSVYASLLLQHAGWTVGQPVMTIHSSGSSVHTTPLPGGFAHGPASLTSSTALPSGVLQLVTVSKVYSSYFPGLLRGEVPLIGILNLHVVPEPGTLLLLGSGVVGLAALGRRRHRG